MSRIGKLLARFNRWLGPAAVGTAIEQGQGQPGTNVNAVGVKAVLTEIEEPAERRDEGV
jgi:hypothetical protein